ncbi:hypothetical protein M514_12056 [Trichuris suis]|uniref:Uncharacterized protein n=1 Tax=Trichuris suis TaxID=68888 RepID=A0A085LQ22_9BILA|nr:hypothetical protein M513_12056 [Trichuris suis]KFD61338.1 hypothetical protein M514_12056 [Trichuris suis]
MQQQHKGVRTNTELVFTKFHRAIPSTPKKIISTAFWNFSMCWGAANDTLQCGPWNCDCAYLRTTCPCGWALPCGTNACSSTRPGRHAPHAITANEEANISYAFATLLFCMICFHESTCYDCMGYISSDGAANICLVSPMCSLCRVIE